MSKCASQHPCHTAGAALLYHMCGGNVIATAQLPVCGFAFGSLSCSVMCPHHTTLAQPSSNVPCIGTSGSCASAQPFKI